jgi:hypothetical protein
VYLDCTGRAEVCQDNRKTLKILPRISVTGISMSFVVVVVLVINGSLDLAARAIVLDAFLFHLSIQGAATEFRCVGQMLRTRDARAVGCHSFGDLNVCRRRCRRPSGKWLVGPRRTSNRARSFFISFVDRGRCYGVLLCRADASHQRRARCWLPFFR